MVAAAIVGGAIIGGVATTMSGNKAASAQENAAKDSNATQLAMDNQNRADLAPYRETGYKALNQLGYDLGVGNASDYATTTGMKPAAYYQDANGDWQYDPGSAGTTTNPSGTFGDLNRNFTAADFNADPGYQFRMDQGSNALERSAAARGGLMNGGTLKALTRYGQDFASNEYSNAYNRFNNDRTQRFNRLAAVAGIGQTATNTTASLGANTANNVAENQIAVGNTRAANAINTGNAINNTVGSLGQFYLSRQYGASAGAGAGSSAGTSAYNYTGPVYSNYV